MKVQLRGSKTWHRVLRWHAVAVVASAGLACGRPEAGGEPVVAQTSALSTPSTVGQWSDPVTLSTSLGPIVPIHMGVLKNGKVLIYGRYTTSTSTTTNPPDALEPPDGPGTPEVFELDPTTLAVTKQDACSTTALFCGGLAQRSDGALVSVGGSAVNPFTTPHSIAPDKGIQDATALTPGGSWTPFANMNNPRWYPSLLTLPGGELLTAGGTYGNFDSNGHLTSQTVATPEVFRSDATWHPLNSAAAPSWFKYYPWLHVLSDGVVYYTGASNTTSYITTSGAGTISPGPSRSAILRDYGTSVMYDQDQILVCGGGSPPQDTCGYVNVAPATRSTAAWQPSPMTYSRKLHNATTLPNGQVLVTGGSTTSGDPGSVRFEETWAAPAILGSSANKGLQIAVAPFSDGRLDVYMIGTDNTVWHRYQDTNMTWQPSASPFWSQVGTVAADDLSVARLPNGTAEVAIVDHTANHNLWHGNVTGTGSVTMQMIGTTANMGKRVIMAPLSTGQLDAYMVGIDNNVWHALFVAGQWQWTRIGSPFSACGSCARPMVVTRRPDDSSEVVILDGNKNIYHDWLSSNGADHAFQLIGNTGNQANQIAVAPFLDGRLDVYMVGLDGRAWHLWQTSLSSTSAVGGVWATGSPNVFFPIGTESVTALAPVRLADGHSDVFAVLASDHFTYHTNGDNAATYPGASGINTSASGAYKRVDNTTATPSQLVASSYVSVLSGGARLDSRASLVQLSSNQNMFFTYQPTGPVFTPELWTPSSKTWQTMAAMQVPRTYHSTAVLLPDGRVLSAGGGAGGIEPDHPNAEIYSPPYFFQNIPQSTITAPSAISYGTQFTVTTSAAAGGVNAVTLVGLSATTHTFNAGQHFNSLSFAQTGPNTLSVTAPANHNVTPEAYYMLFVLDRGVPSVAQIVQVH